MKEQEQKHNGFPPSNLPRDPETGYFLDVPARIREIYKHNCFMSDFFHISIDEIYCGGAQVSLHIEHDKHANHRNVNPWRRVDGAGRFRTGSDRRFCRRSCSNCKLFYGFHQ